VLGIPLNIDQHYLMDAVQRRGAGLSLRAGQITPEATREAAAALLGEKRFRQAAQQLQRQVRACDPARALARTIAGLCGRTAPGLEPAGSTNHAAAGELAEVLP
jgi:UDP:flavonoid glycosyltransferase YjiC (YdhE family)